MVGCRAATCGTPHRRTSRLSPAQPPGGRLPTRMSPFFNFAILVQRIDPSLQKYPFVPIGETAVRPKKGKRGKRGKIAVPLFFPKFLLELTPLGGGQRTSQPLWLSEIILDGEFKRT